MRFCQNCGHAVSNDAGKFCSFCGQALTPAPEAAHAPAAHNTPAAPAAPAPRAGNEHGRGGAKPSSKKILISVIASVSLLAAATVFGLLVITHVICLSHRWQDATCEEPDTCVYCGKTQGDALGHEWEDATCEEPKTCAECGKTKGDKLEHSWLDATCSQPRECFVCGKTEGEPTDHVIGEWAVISEPTLIAKGSQEAYCWMCGEVVGTYSIPAKQPEADGSGFNFTDVELLDWINANTEMSVEYTNLISEESEVVFTVYIIEYEGSKGGLIINHGDNGIDGNICAVLTWFPEWEKKVYLAMTIGTMFDSQFYSDAAIEAIAYDNEYRTAGLLLTTAKLSDGMEVALLVPIDYLAEAGARST